MELFSILTAQKLPRHCRGSFALAAALCASLRALALLCRLAAFLCCHSILKKRVRATKIENITSAVFLFFII